MPRWFVSGFCLTVIVVVSYLPKSAELVRSFWSIARFFRIWRLKPGADPTDPLVSLWSWWLWSLCWFRARNAGWVVWLSDRTWSHYCKEYPDHQVSKSTADLSSSVVSPELVTRKDQGLLLYFTSGRSAHFLWHFIVFLGNWVQKA